MTKSKKNPKVDLFISKAKKWKEETEKLRLVLLECGLTEDLKWNKPCYSLEKSNIAIIQGFKEYFALLFFKGFLLKDPNGILVKTGENTIVGRQIRFSNAREIVKMKPIIVAYIDEAIAVEKADLNVGSKKKIELALPKEFQTRLDKIPALKTAFNTLTPGRQRAYNIYFSQPKQSKTRESRIEKWLPQILSGKGLND